MSTLKELFDKHGSVWLAYKVNPNIKAFKPLAYSERHDYEIIGETYFYNTPATSFVKSYEDLILYEEPKPKVKRYKYAYINESETHWQDSKWFYRDDNDFYKNTNRVASFKRLDYTETEFEE